MAERQKKSTAPPAGTSIRLRPRLVMGLLVVLGLGVGGHQLWQHFGPSVSRHPQYAITADRIHISPPPPWIRTNVRGEVLRDAGLVGRLSVVDGDGQLLERLEGAFEFHPWVASVERITKSLPAAIEIELTYRRPVVAVETVNRSGAELLPIDVDGVRLPENDLTEAEKRYLPRVTGAFAKPLVGQVWSDRRVLAGAQLASKLAEDWHSLRLVELAPLADDSLDPTAPPEFEIITSGGTRILWGAAPGEESSSESSFADKLRRLRQYATEHSNLHSIDGPKVLDVRTDLRVEPRTAREKQKRLAAKDSNPDLPGSPEVPDSPAVDSPAVASRDDDQRVERQ